MVNRARKRGWEWNEGSTRLDTFVNGTTVMQHTTTATTFPLATTFTLGSTVTAGGLTVTAGNANLGGAGTFGTTQPNMALILNSGTAPVGAITTAGGIFASDTVVRKIIADGTASNVET